MTWGWLRTVGEVLGLVERAIPIVEDLTGLDCPSTERSETIEARIGQAAGAAANASQAATTERMRH
jgi:hypothetical protein